MRSQLYYLCLLAVYAAASPLHKILPEAQVRTVVRKDGKSHALPHKRADTSTKVKVHLASSRGSQPSTDDCDDDEHDMPSSSQAVTVKVVPVTATKTKTVDITAMTTTSRTNTRYSTSTATKTVTKSVQQAASPTKTTSSTSSKPTSTKQSSTKTIASATTTLSTLVTPIPTSSNYVFAGMASYYYTGLGACGWWSNDSDMVVALPDHVYDNFPGATPWWDTNGNPVCGKQILATWGTQTIQVTVVDRCVGCETYQLDLSPTAFAALTDGNLDMGLAYGLTWRWL